MIGEVLGHFRILERLGAGGMGEVYLALDLKLDRKVALKFIHVAYASDPEARKRFEREARALAALDHPYVGAVYGVEEAAGRLFIVLAYIEGQSLDSMLSRSTLFSRTRARAPSETCRRTLRRAPPWNRPSRHGRQEPTIGRARIARSGCRPDRRSVFDVRLGRFM